MKQPALAPKGTPERLVQEARIAWDRNDLSRCAELLEQASRKMPDDIGLLVRLGGTYGAIYDYAAAERTFEKACALAPPDRQSAVFAGVAETARNFVLPDIAERYFGRALEATGATPEMFASMAEFCERRRNLENASRLVNQALELNSECEKALLVRARLLVQREDLEESERELNRLLERTADNDIRIRAGSELGAVLDRQGRYDEAINQFVQAKNLARPAAEGQVAPRQVMRQRWAQMRTQISRERLDRWFEFGREFRAQRRLALLAGHPHSGTTLLEQVLSLHPDIVSMEETNHFFVHAHLPLKRRWPADTPIVKVLEAASKELLEACRDRYFRVAELCVGSPIGDRLLIDHNPALTVLVPALVRVFPEIKLLVAMRDPRDVVLSCFLQPVLEVERVSYPDLSLKTTVDAYVAVMQTWLTVGPMLQSPWLEVRYEHMVEDLESTVRKALEFLDVPWDECVLPSVKHARNKTVRSPTYPDLTQTAFRPECGRWRNYQKYLEPHLHVLQPFVKAFGYE